MIFKIKLSTLIIAIATIAFVSSCKKDEAAAPVISGLEVGDGNSLSAIIGSDLHMDATIEAEGKISKIEIELHNEEGSGDEIEAVFTNYAGQKNADFHEHIDIPSTVAAGEYHFHIKVVDEEGQTTEADRDVMVTAPADTAPVISGLEVGTNDSHMAMAGDELHLDAEITASQLIDYIEVELHPEGFVGDDIEAQFTNYSGESSIDFHEHIEIPASAAAGEYHMHFKVVDQAGQITDVDADVTIQ